MSALPPLLPSPAHADLAAATAVGVGRGLERAATMSPEQVTQAVADAGLRGRGGAFFPTSAKWRSVVEAALPGQDRVTVVCNAAEGEPGTYKDRPLLAHDPYTVLEGLLIASHATGAEASYLATKARFGPQRAALKRALDEVCAAGWHGADRLQLVFGPDEYLFGEESALLEVVEGRLPLPRVLKPYMEGLWASPDGEAANPTVVNNVETLAHVARILAHGAEAFRADGAPSAPGTMLYTVTGDVAAPGVYELATGTPLRTLLVDVAGARDVKAVYSGVAGAVITPDLLDLAMEPDAFAAADVGLGSGGFVVYDTSRCIVAVTAALARFLAVESCGQCLQCKLGTGEILERLEGLVEGTGAAADVDVVAQRCQNVADGNRCYLPVGAALLVRSTIGAFHGEFLARARASAPTPPEARVPVPKITALDLGSGTVTFDPDYARKRRDWTYADA